MGNIEFGSGAGTASSARRAVNGPTFPRPTAYPMVTCASSIRTAETIFGSELSAADSIGFMMESSQATKLIVVREITVPGGFMRTAMEYFGSVRKTG